MIGDGRPGRSSEVAVGGDCNGTTGDRGFAGVCIRPCECQRSGARLGETTRTRNCSGEREITGTTCRKRARTDGDIAATLNRADARRLRGGQVHVERGSRRHGHWRVWREASGWIVGETQRPFCDECGAGVGAGSRQHEHAGTRFREVSRRGGACNDTAVGERCCSGHVDRAV